MKSVKNIMFFCKVDKILFCFSWMKRGFQNQLLNPCFKRLCIYWCWQEFGKPNSISINLLHFAYHEWKLHTLTKSGYLLSSVRIEGRELRGSKGPFTNYVDKFLSFFDHLPPCVDIFYLMKLTKSQHFWTTY